MDGENMISIMHASRKNTKAQIGTKRLKFICPMCGGILSTMNLPDPENVLERIYDDSVIHIVGCTIRAEYKFYHYYTENGYEFMDEFHPVIAALEIIFDSTGKCIVFDILDVFPCSTKLYGC